MRGQLGSLRLCSEDDCVNRPLRVKCAGAWFYMYLPIVHSGMLQLWRLWPSGNCSSKWIWRQNSLLVKIYYCDLDRNSWCGKVTEPRGWAKDCEEKWMTGWKNVWIKINDHLVLGVDSHPHPHTHFLFLSLTNVEITTWWTQNEIKAFQWPSQTRPA